MKMKISCIYVLFTLFIISCATTESTMKSKPENNLINWSLLMDGKVSNDFEVVKDFLDKRYKTKGYTFNTAPVVVDSNYKLEDLKKISDTGKFVILNVITDKAEQKEESWSFTYKINIDEIFIKENKNKSFTFMSETAVSAENNKIAVEKSLIEAFNQLYIYLNSNNK